MKTKITTIGCLLTLAVMPLFAQEPIESPPQLLAVATTLPPARQPIALPPAQAPARPTFSGQQPTARTPAQASQRLRSDLNFRAASENRALINDLNHQAYGYQRLTTSPAIAGLAKANNESNREIAKLVEQIREAESDDEKSELKNEVQQLLETQYDDYLSYHEKPLLDLEERLEKLRADFDKRKAAKEDLVKLRLDTIWYNAIGLGWPQNNGAPSSLFAPTATFPAPGQSPLLRSPSTNMSPFAPNRATQPSAMAVPDEPEPPRRKNSVR